MSFLATCVGIYTCVCEELVSQGRVPKNTVCGLQLHVQSIKTSLTVHVSVCVLAHGHTNSSPLETEFHHSTIFVCTCKSLLPSGELHYEHELHVRCIYMLSYTYVVDPTFM